MSPEYDWYHPIGRELGPTERVDVREARSCHLPTILECVL